MSEPGKAVFLSYASQDAAAALRLCAALRAAGVEVWFDQNELVGGDAWDAKIRKQIAECALFVPVISAATQARTEGYFRLEWKLAAQRTHMIADDAAFLLPVVIDETRDADARVPAEFKSVQWTRLPGAEAPEKFCARVQSLLGSEGRDASPRRPSAEAHDKPGSLGMTSLPVKASRPWFVPMMVGVAFLVAVAALAFWQPWRAKEKSAPSASPVATIAPAAPLSEAQQLIAKIAAIVEKEADATRDDWGLAEAMGAQAVKLEPGNAEAWAAYAQGALGLWEFYTDRARSPLPDALKRVRQASSLAPASDEVLLALANCYRFPAETQAEAETILRKLMAKHPEDRRVLRTLAATVRTKHSRQAVASPATKTALEEALALYERAVAMPGDDPVSWREMSAVLVDLGRYAEAETALERSLALRNGPAAMVRKIWFLLRVRHDVHQACAAVEALPGSYFLREDVVELAALAWLWQGDAARCLRVLNAWNDDFLAYTPKGFLAGQAYHVLQRPDAARFAWRDGLNAVEKQLASMSGGGFMQRSHQIWKVRLLGLLGEKESAEAMMRILEQSGRGGGSHWANALVTRGRLDDALNWLTPAVEITSATRYDGYNGPLTLRASLRFDPMWNPLRGLPRFEALLAGIRSPIETAKGAAINKSAAPEKSVAVLAFKNLSGDPAREFFSDGLSDVVSDVLGRVPGLKVVGSASALSFKGKAVPIPEIARQLGVTHLVEGTVLQEGTNVRITAKLIKADGFQEWGSDPLERESKNIFALYDEVAALIAKNLSLKLGASSAVSKVAINPEAFELYVQARQAWSLRTTAGFERAESALTRALALEPNFARAHAALADVWAQRLWRNLAANEADAKSGGPERARIKAKITHALMLDSNSSEAHAALGDLLSHDGQNAEAERALRRAVVLNPNLAVAHQWLGLVLLNTGNIDAALNHLKLATELDPFAPVIWRSYGSGLRCAGRYSESILAANRALLLKSDEAQALWDKLTNLVALGRSPEAVELVRPLVGTNGLIGASKLFVFAQTGLKAEAEALLTERRSSRYWAGGLITLGRTEEAVTFLTTLWFHQYFAAEYLWDPIYDPIRNDARWMKLIADAGLTEAHARAQAWRKAHPPEKPAAKP